MTKAKITALKSPRGVYFVERQGGAVYALSLHAALREALYGNEDNCQVEWIGFPDDFSPPSSADVESDRVKEIEF